MNSERLRVRLSLRSIPPVIYGGFPTVPVQAGITGTF